MPGEAELVSQAKGYDPNAAEAKRQVDSYFQNFGDRDTFANWSLTVQMAPPGARDEMERLYGEAKGMTIEPQPFGVDTHASAAEKGSGTVPEPTPVPTKGVSMADANAANYGTLPSPRQDALAETASTVDKDIAARAGTGSLPDAAPPTQNASLQTEGAGRPYDILHPGVVTLGSSQSSNQGVVEPEEARQLREFGMDQEMQGAEDVAFASSFAAQDRLRVANERQKKLIELQKEDAEFQARQNRIAQESEARIAKAEQALKDAEVDPNFNPMREIMQGDDWGKKIMMGMGALFGAIGSSAQSNALGTYVPNQFFEQYEKAVNRKIDLMEKRYRARKDYLGAAQDGYARMRQILQDEAATRAMIEARAWQMFDSEVDKIGQQYGLDTQNAQYMAMRAEIANKYRQKVMESARTTQHVVGTQQQQEDVKVVPLGGGEDKTSSNIKAIVQERQKKELPLIEGALDNMATGIASMAKDEASRDQLAVILRTGNGLGKGMARYLAHDKAGFARIGAALGDYARIKSGTAQTKIELENLAGLVGTGDLEALRQFYGILQNERRAKESDIQTMEDYDKFTARKDLYSGNPRTQTYEPRVDPIGKSAVK